MLSISSHLDEELKVYHTNSEFNVFSSFWKFNHFMLSIYSINRFKMKCMWYFYMYFDCIWTVCDGKLKNWSRLFLLYKMGSDHPTEYYIVVFTTTLKYMAANRKVGSLKCSLTDSHMHEIKWQANVNAVCKCMNSMKASEKALTTHNFASVQQNRKSDDNRQMEWNPMRYYLD